MGYDEDDLRLRGGFRGGGNDEMDSLLDPPPQSTRVRSASRYGSRCLGGMRLRSNSSGPPESSSSGAPKSTSASGPPPGGGGNQSNAPTSSVPSETNPSSGPPSQSQAPPPQGSSSQQPNPGKSQVVIPPPILRSSSSKGILNDNLGPALTRLGRSIGLSVEIFAAVGETIADENPEIRGDMLEACRESRAVGNSLEKLCEGLSLCLSNARNGSSTQSSMLPRNLSGGGLLHSLSPSDFETLIRSARVLLSGVTRILLLADNVVVNKLLISKDGDEPPKAVVPSSSSVICDQLSSLKTMHHFTEFVKAFCDYGSEMVHFLRLIGDEDRRDKEDRRRCQIDCARLILDRSATLLLTATQSFLHHPDQSSARENRDTVFCQMRRALDLIHYIIKEGVVEASNKFCLGHPIDQSPVMTETCISEELSNSTVLRAMKYFEDSVEIMRMSIVSDSYKEQITSSLESIIERTQDFTDSAYTSHDHRQNIIMLCERSTIELAHLLRTTMSNNPTHHRHHHSHAPNNPIDMSPVAPLEFDEALRNLLKTTKELGLELQQIALEHAGSLISNCRIGRDILHNLKGSALSADSDRLALQSERLTEYMDYVEDVAKLVRHVTRTESAQIRAKHAQINLHIYGSQVPVAAATLCHDPHSKVAKDNLETFCTMWQYLVDDVIQISKHVADTTINGPHNRHSITPFIQQHKSVPNLGMGMSPGNAFLAVPKEDIESRRHSSPGLVQHPPQHTPYSMMGPHPPPIHHQSQQQQQQQQPPSTHYYPSAYRHPEEFLNSFKDVEKNEIINRSKKMASITKCMFNFTRGEGKVKTTQDLFTQAEYFAEESNLLYKVIRIFSYDVPTGEDKRVLMAIADNVPKHCHQMQMLIQSTTVGKAATFTKVDSIIKETRTIMQLVVRIVEVCYSNATKYNLDFSNVSSEGRTHTSDDTSQTFGSSGASGSGTNSASDSS
ncbi:alpha-catulin [Lepeophtheirus salmonis]|uniref:alpha-catulin n=1 Tax=Lepeophtheirus salmonis TaxID=72036 RepID=UPI001AE5A7C4|nr:alpha-catulin-like [Lepeophtheirus salmonis]